VFLGQADGGEELDSGGAGGISAEGGRIEAEGAPADTHPGGSKGDAGPACTPAGCPVAAPFACRELDGGCGCSWAPIAYCPDTDAG
jgi:hypothetical protein